MLDPQAQQYLAFGTAVAMTVAAVLKYLPGFLRQMRAESGNGKTPQQGHSQGVRSGDLSAHEWEGRMLELNRKANEEQMADIRNLLEIRVGQIVQDRMNTLERSVGQIVQDKINTLVRRLPASTDPQG